MTDKDWEELEHGPFINRDDKNYIKYNNYYNDIYSKDINDSNYDNDNDNDNDNDIEYFYKCSKCNASWDEYKKPKCICLDENDFVSFKDHEIENIPIKLDTKKMDTKYLDELILHEYGKHDINKYTEWTNDWYKWLNDEKKSDKSKIKSIVLEQKKVDSKDLKK